MGTYADILKKDEVTVPEHKREEFKKRVEQLFQAGGMMEVKHIQLCGREVNTIKKASMHDDNMDFFYNYFEDDRWESAGFHKNSFCVYSNKIGWRHFHLAIVAAYVLEMIYLDGTSIPMVDGRFEKTRIFVEWINYLFHENFAVKNNDPWKLFEVMHEQDDENGYERTSHCDWEVLVKDVCGLIGYFEIRAVMYGTEEALKEFNDLKNEEYHTPFSFLEKLKKIVEEYQKENEKSEDAQLSSILKMLCSLYKKEDTLHNIGEKCEDGRMKDILFLAVLSDAPAFVIKILAEAYDKEFWELWNMVKEGAERRLYQNTSVEVAPVTTAEFFVQDPDDMILYWEDDGEIKFSNELKKWFKDLRNRFDEITRDEIIAEGALKWIMGLMEYADDNYYRIFAINDFFEETLEHLNDCNYLKLWKIYDEMLHDPEMEEAGRVIFVSERAEYESMEPDYFDEQPYRRLITNWSVMDIDKRNNKARVTFRRYMALVANRKLRKKVFGF